MSRRDLTCLRCGHEGPDVDMTLVDAEAEARADGEAMSDVDVELVTPLRHVEERFRLRVPRRYGAEWRCRDREACETRFRALSAAPPNPMPPAAAPAADAEEVPSWMQT